MHSVVIRIALTLVLYAAALATLATPLYEDDILAPAVIVVAAHVGLGIGIARWWALIVPVAAVLVLAVFSPWWLIALPPLVGLSALGWLIGIGPRWLRRVAAGTCCALAAVFVLSSGFSYAQRGPHVPADVQNALPTEYSLGNLCPHVHEYLLRKGKLR